MSASGPQNPVPKLYQSVVEDVISNVREAFLDEGVDEQVLEELKQLWLTKLKASKALDDPPPPKAEPLLVSSNSHLALQSMTFQPSHQLQTAQTATRPVRGVSAGAAGISHSSQMQLPMHLNSNPDLSVPATAAAMALPAGLFQQQFAARGITLQATSTGQYLAVQTVPTHGGGVGQPQLVTIGLAQHGGQPLTLNQQQLQHAQTQGIPQLDGTAGDTSSEEEEFENEENEENEEEQNEEEAEEPVEEEEPLNTDDDISDEDPTELFDTDNVVVCQYDKINRSKNKWKFTLKDGIMNLNGKDFVFQKALGDAEW